MNQQPPKNVWRDWLVNNRFTIAMINLLLFFLVICVFNKISFVLNPFWAFFNAIFPPLLLAGLQYYLMNPVVDFLQKRWHVPRTVTITILFVLFVLLLVWLLNWIVPIVQQQLQSLIKNWPRYWRDAQATIQHAAHDPHLQYMHKDFNKAISQVRKAFANYDMGSAMSSINSAVSVVTMTFMTLLTAPFVLFFMLKDGHQLRPAIAKFAPARFQASFSKLLGDINQAVAQYVRGQLIVAFWVAVMFGVGYSLIGQSYAILLAVIAGLCNLIPYFGTFIAMIPSLVLAIMNSPMMLVKVLIVFAIEQTLEGRVISPLVMGNKMKMHPVTTILILIGASAVAGLWGVIFAIPVYAVIKIIVQRVFNYYQRVSSFYQGPIVAEPERKPKKDD
jgi:predicted PurR-regulated permease PerM